MATFYNRIFLKYETKPKKFNYRHNGSKQAEMFNFAPFSFCQLLEVNINTSLHL